mgnify:CR=1 FL=1
MLVVHNKRELKEALNSGVKVFQVEGNKLHYGLKWGTKIKEEKPIVAASELTNSAINNIICEAKVSEGVILGAVAMVSIVAIVAIVLNYKGKITYTPRPGGGTVTVEGGN